MNHLVIKFARETNLYTQLTCWNVMQHNIITVIVYQSILLAVLRNIATIENFHFFRYFRKKTASIPNNDLYQLVQNRLQILSNKVRCWDWCSFFKQLHLHYAIINLYDNMRRQPYWKYPFFLWLCCVVLIT